MASKHGVTYRYSSCRSLWSTAPNIHGSSDYATPETLNIGPNIEFTLRIAFQNTIIYNYTKGSGLTARSPNLSFFCKHVTNRSDCSHHRHTRPVAAGVRVYPRLNRLTALHPDPHRDDFTDGTYPGFVGLLDHESNTRRSDQISALGPKGTPEMIEHIKTQLGLNDPIDRAIRPIPEADIYA